MKQRLRKTYDSRQVIKIIREKGWREIRCKSTHRYFGHPEKRDWICVPHPKKQLSPNVIKNIERATGIDL